MKIMNIFRCKLLVIGGGTGGCTMAAKFARRLKKDAVIVLEPSSVSYDVHKNFLIKSFYSIRVSQDS